MTTSLHNPEIAALNYGDFSDNELLNLVGESQDRDALTELYNRFKPIIGRFLQRDNCDSKLIGEVYNDVMLAVWRNAKNFRGDSKVSTWLFSISYRIRLAHSRKEWRHKHSYFDELVVEPESENASYIDEPSSQSEAITVAMKELTEPHRVAVELSYFHGYSILEIANIVRCPQNTVKTRLFHARKKLKEALEANKLSEAALSNHASHYVF